MTGQGLWRFDDNGWTLAIVGAPGSPAPPFPTALVQTTDGVWWIGTEYGLFYYKANSWHCVHVEQEQARVRGVRGLLVRGKDLWAACAEGLWLYAERTWTQRTLWAKEPNWPVYALAASDSGLWIASVGGILHYDLVAQKVNQHWTPRNSGLSSSAVNSMLETDGYLWVATSAGLSRATL